LFKFNSIFRHLRCAHYDDLEETGTTVQMDDSFPQHQTTDETGEPPNSDTNDRRHRQPKKGGVQIKKKYFCFIVIFSYFYLQDFFNFV
jgi:hypothetical protein